MVCFAASFNICPGPGDELGNVPCTCGTLMVERLPGCEGLWTTCHPHFPFLAPHLHEHSNKREEEGGEECQQLALVFTLSSKTAQTTIKGSKLLGDVAAYFRKLGYSSQLQNKKKRKAIKDFPEFVIYSALPRFSFSLFWVA